MSIIGTVLSSAIVATNVCSADSVQALPKSGDLVQIGDFRYVILSEQDFTKLSAKVDLMFERWNAANSNESGRVAFHGQSKHRTFDADTECYVTEYADGYRHVESVARSKGRRHDAVAPKSDIPERLREIRARRRAKASQTNEVSVIVGGGK